MADHKTKALVTSYAAFVIDDIVQILKNTTMTDKEQQVLEATVLLTLQKSFENDQDGNVTL